MVNDKQTYRAVFSATTDRNADISEEDEEGQKGVSSTYQISLLHLSPG